MKLRPGDVGSFGALITLDGAPVRFCTFADDEVGCVVVLVTTSDGDFVLDHEGDAVSLVEETRFGVVRITLGATHAPPPGTPRHA